MNRVCPLCSSPKPSQLSNICSSAFHLLCDDCFCIKGLVQPDPEANGNRYASCRGVKSDYRSEKCKTCGAVYWEDYARD